MTGVASAEHVEHEFHSEEKVNPQILALMKRAAQFEENIKKKKYTIEDLKF